jgi:soluble lytic murein transglycosylase-like protein
LGAALAAACLAQDPRAAMEASIAKQRESIEKQKSSIQAAQPAAGGDGFFHSAWSARLIPPPPPVPECDPVPEEEIGPLVEEAAKREGLTPDLLRAVIEKESAYVPCAVSSKGAQGLMQLMPGTAADMGVQDPFDPRQNVGGGARFLKQLMQKYDGNLVLALAAYNAGPGRVDTAGGVPPIPETLDYISKILDKVGK